MNKAVSDIIQIDPALAVPVYKQIVQSVIRNIEKGVLAKDDLLPSVNKIAETFSLARGSVFTAYNDLRASGVIDSIPGKGYYIANTDTRQGKRILVLLSSLSANTPAFYHALQQSLPVSYTIDLFFYNHSITSFESQIKQHAGYYNFFIIVPMPHPQAGSILSQLDAKAMLLAETGFKEFKKTFAGVYQNIEKDLYSLLLSRHQSLSKYNRLVLVASGESSSKELAQGMNKFAKKASMPAVVMPTLETAEINKGDACIIATDEDLVSLAGHCREQKWKPGKDIGILSYHEHLLKGAIADGISTLGPDYEAMSASLSEMIVLRRREVMENKYIFTDRKSF